MSRKLGIGLAAVLILIGTAIIVFLKLSQQPTPLPLPQSVSSQISFVIYLPDSKWSINQPSITYKAGVLSLEAKQGGSTMQLTQQATPEVFNDVPEYYPTLLSKLRKYSSISSANGTANLTKPTELKGQQQAILNSNGTLLFAHPNKNLNEDDWRRFFNSLQVIKP